MLFLLEGDQPSPKVHDTVQIVDSCILYVKTPTGNASNGELGRNHWKKQFFVKNLVTVCFPMQRRKYELISSEELNKFGLAATLVFLRESPHLEIVYISAFKKRSSGINERPFLRIHFEMSNCLDTISSCKLAPSNFSDLYRQLLLIREGNCSYCT